MSIVAEAPGYIQVFSDGTVKRFAPEIAPASTELSNGFRSKDVIINPTKPITARLFVPDVPASIGQLPVLVYFHGGGFSIGSTTWLGYHQFLGDFSVLSKSIVFSVDYRLAPENKLPIAYADCYSSLEWLAKNLKSEPWLGRADLSRVFLSGDSAGGNIAHQVTVMAILEKLPSVTIKGLLSIHPYFGSEKRTERELLEDLAADVALHDMFWELSIPKGSNRDYYGCNYEKAEVSNAVWSQFPSVAVYIAGLDFLRERGVKYAEFLKSKGVKVELTEAEGERHVYHVFDPKSKTTLLLQKNMSEFIHNL